MRRLVCTLAFASQPLVNPPWQMGAWLEEAGTLSILRRFLRTVDDYRIEWGYDGSNFSPSCS